MKRSLTAALCGALFVAAVSTLGDFMWAEVLPRPHPAWYGVAHGITLFLCIGLVLGSPVGRRAGAAAGSALIGGLASVAFYLLAPFTGYAVMFPLWFAFWIALGILYERLHAGAIRWSTALKAGLLAATLSGLAFYLISGIWFPFRPRGWDYVGHFFAWTFAYFPGFAAIIAVRGQGR
jgi:hypothetical protein